jgi:hypothetical protein
MPLKKPWCRYCIAPRPIPYKQELFSPDYHIVNRQITTAGPRDCQQSAFPRDPSVRRPQMY